MVISGYLRENVSEPVSITISPAKEANNGTNEEKRAADEEQIDKRVAVIELDFSARTIQMSTGNHSELYTSPMNFTDSFELKLLLNNIYLELYIGGRMICWIKNEKAWSVMKKVSEARPTWNKTLKVEVSTSLSA